MATKINYDELFYDACEDGDIQQVKSLYKHVKDGMSRDYFTAACHNIELKNKHDFVKFVISLGIPMSALPITLYADDGNFEMVKFLHECGSPWEGVLESAAIGGHLDIVKYAIEHECPLNPYDIVDTEFMVSREHGVLLRDIDVMEYFKSIGWEISEDLQYYAIDQYNMKLLEYALDQGHQLNRVSFSYGIQTMKYSDIMMNFLMEKKCPYDVVDVYKHLRYNTYTEKTQNFIVNLVKNKLHEISDHKLFGEITEFVNKI